MSDTVTYRHLRDGTKVSAAASGGRGFAYRGSFVYSAPAGGAESLESVAWDEGRVMAAADGSLRDCWLVADRLGCVRAVVDLGSQDATDAVLETDGYLPFGTREADSLSLERNRWRFAGKEEQRFGSADLALSDFGARLYDPFTARWTAPDPLAAKSPSLSPYAYCADNPVSAVDPDGRETHIVQNGDGTYRVIGGVLNKDRNIYVYTKDKDGNYTVRGNSIGISSSTTSFYDSDVNNGKGAWAIGSIINPKDQSGLIFLDNIIGNNPAMFNDYIANAGNDERYDFKSTNGTDKPIDKIDHYRGMPVGGNNKTGVVTYSSARDIGNIAAGFIAGANGMSWVASRIAFDSYQSNVSGSPTIEGLSTRNAQYYGWRTGSNNNTHSQKARNFLRSIRHLISK